MSMLLVEASSFLPKTVSQPLRMCVSVSRDDDGKPVTGLKKSNFRVASLLTNTDFQVVDVFEWLWEPAAAERAGCYEIWVTVTPPPPEHGPNWLFGLQVRIFAPKHLPDEPASVVDCGQTVVTVW
jgi:hypothetical protein